MLVRIDQIQPDPNQPRKLFSEAEINGLAKSLQTDGMINDIEVDENFIIITGERRWRAAKKLGWAKVPVKINKASYDTYSRLRHQMAENVHQASASGASSMNPIDVARGYAKMLKLKGYDFPPGGKFQGADHGIAELARELGIADTTIRQYIQLLAQPHYVVDDLLAGRPRTYYRDAETAPEEYRETIKQKIAKGEYANRDQIREDLQTIRQVPSIAETELIRKKSQEDEKTNKLLNEVAKLALAMEALPLDAVNPKEEAMIRSRVLWLLNQIRNYLGTD